MFKFMPSRSIKLTNTQSYEPSPGSILTGTSFMLGAQLGEGTFGKVFKATTNGQDYAIKMCGNTTEQEKEINKKESDILSKIFSSNLTDHLLRSSQQFSYGPYFVCVMEELDISLHDFVIKGEFGPLKPEVIKTMFNQILLGSTALLKLGYVHCDIKMENIMLCKGEEIRVKLVDFGLSVSLDKIESHSSGGSLGYMAPEVILDNQLSVKVDSWSIGCVLFALYTGFELFQTETKFQAMQQYLEVFGYVPEELEDSDNYDRYFCKDRRTNRIYLREPSCGAQFALKQYDRQGFGKLTELGLNAQNGSITCLDHLLVRFVKILLQPAPSVRPCPNETLKYWKQLCEFMEL